MKTHMPMIGALAFALLAGGSAMNLQGSERELTADVARGKYLVQIAGCNDCHTPEYAFTGGKVDEKLWLTGDALGWRGPWGTTYPPNLRLLVTGMTADQFMKHARSDQRRPPMPWFSLRDMTDADVKAIYAYIKHLGPAGQAAPAYVPPGQEPRGPVVVFPE